MSVIYRFRTLEDAHYFVNQVHGLPDVPNAARMRERFIRAGIILSWAALEEARTYFVESGKLSARPNFPKNGKPLEVIRYVAEANGKAVRMADLERARALRNDATHFRPDSTYVVTITEQNCKFVFDTCLAAICAMSRHRVECSG